MRVYAVTEEDLDEHEMFGINLFAFKFVAFRHARVLVEEYVENHELQEEIDPVMDELFLRLYESPPVWRFTHDGYQVTIERGKVRWSMNR